MPQVLLRSVRPEMVLSGDDHDHCSVLHRLGSSETEEVLWKPSPVPWLGGIKGLSDWGAGAWRWWGGAASRDGGVRAQDTKREDWFSGDSRGRAAAIGHCLGGVGSLEAEEHTLGTISMLQGLLLSCLLGPLVSDKMPCISWR